jgi:hypothetical protein
MGLILVEAGIVNSLRHMAQGAAMLARLVEDHGP